MKNCRCQLKMWKREKMWTGNPMFQNFFREYSSKKCADSWNGPGTWMGRPPHLASPEPIPHCSYFMETSGSLSVSPPLSWNSLSPRRGGGGVRQPAELPLQAFACLEHFPVLFLKPANPSGAFALAYPLIHMPFPSLTAPSFSPIEMSLAF